MRKGRGKARRKDWSGVEGRDGGGYRKVGR